MRALVAALLVCTASASIGSAEPLPSGAIGITTGAVAGTGADSPRVGAGFYEFGAQASWQPTATERRWGWTIRWAALFGLMYGGSSAHIDTTLRTVQMDLTVGVRVRPWSSVSRYLTFRGGAELLTSNEPIVTDTSMTGTRRIVGAVGAIGIDQYVSIFMLNIDVRYSMIGTNPAELSLMVGGAFAGP
jgi:hypothetical protein